ncbi:MAG: Acylamino-acid-releasing enzyme, partial [uncultured Pseudonocardia sp.]
MSAEVRAAPTAARELADALVDAWGSWGPTLDPDCRRLAFVSDRSGTPSVWVDDLPVDGAAPAHVQRVLSEDPVVAVSWSADGAWLAVCVATDGGVRTQVW